MTIRRGHTAIANLLAILACCGSVMISGCASKPVAAIDPLAVAPQDFSLDMTVMTGRGVNITEQAKLYRGRFVLESDGSLHQGVAEVDWWGARWLPERTRTLNREQVAQVWSLTQRMGVIDPARGNENINLYLVDPSPGEVKYLLATTANENRMTFVRANKVSEPGDPAMLELVHTLAELAWVSPTPDMQGYVIPMRYDFGPDPYAQFRREAAK